MLGYTFFTGQALKTIFGEYRKKTGEYVDSWSGQTVDMYEYKPRLPLIPALIIAVPIAGTLNNLTFSNSALGSAGSALNYKLITDNPEIDLFYYPKYTIHKEWKIWKQKASLKANVMGAKLKLD